MQQEDKDSETLVNLPFSSFSRFTFDTETKEWVVKVCVRCTEYFLNIECVQLTCCILPFSSFGRFTTDKETKEWVVKVRVALH